MTGRTHDLAAFTALNFVIATQPIPEVSLPTIFIAFGANMIGGLAPDIDQSTSNFWDNIRGGNVLARLISPLLGGHRFISHSILGVIIFGFLSEWVLNLLGTFLIVDLNVVWWAFMIGYISHLLIDTITRDGVPYLFPIPLRFGIPPFRFLKIKTGGFIEKSIIFPLLLIANGYLFYTYYPKYLEFLRGIIR